MSNPNAPTRPRAWWRGLGAIALLGYAVFLAFHSAPVAGGSDSSGYLNSARLLAAGKLLTDLRSPPEFGPAASLDPMHFLPQGFFPAREPGRLTPTYPTGLPLHFAAAGKLLGWKLGPLAVMLLAGISAVWLCYQAARDLGVDRSLAGAGAVALAVCPVFLFTSIQPLSDTLATAWTLAALCAALRGRRSAGWAAAGGLAFALGVLVRPTNLVLAPAFLVILGLQWKTLLCFIAGGLPGAAWFAGYNHHLYGSAFRSGYGDIFAAFALRYGAPTALHFARWLALLLPSVLLVLPFAALRDRGTRTREWYALLLAFLTTTGLYAFYEVSHEVWWCLRFILPVIPALILAGLLGTEVLVRKSSAPSRWRAVAAGVLVIWAIGASAYWSPRLGVFQMKHFERAYAEGSMAARERLPREALVVSFAFSGALYFYTEHAVLRWDQLPPEAFGRYVTAAQQAGRPICAVLFDWEEKDAFRRCPGPWQRLANVGNVALWQMAPPHPPRRLP